jgi:hypothetical protein
MPFADTANVVDKMPDEIKLSKRAETLIVGGVYEHYSGKKYNLIGVAHHSEDLSELVVYQAQYGNKLIWVRPLEMFLENVEIEGVTKPRFKYVGNN